MPEHSSHYSASSPAAGAVHSAVRIGPQRLAELVEANWIDVCQEPA